MPSERRGPPLSRLRAALALARGPAEFDQQHHHQQQQQQNNHKKQTEMVTVEFELLGQTRATAPAAWAELVELGTRFDLALPLGLELRTALLVHWRYTYYGWLYLLRRRLTHSPRRRLTMLTRLTMLYEGARRDVSRDAAAPAASRRWRRAARARRAQRGKDPHRGRACRCHRLQVGPHPRRCRHVHAAVHCHGAARRARAHAAPPPGVASAARAVTSATAAVASATPAPPPPRVRLRAAASAAYHHGLTPLGHVRALQVMPTVAAHKPGRKAKKPKPPFTLALGVTCTILP